MKTLNNLPGNQSALIGFCKSLPKDKLAETKAIFVERFPDKEAIIDDPSVKYFQWLGDPSKIKFMVMQAGWDTLNPVELLRVCINKFGFGKESFDYVARLVLGSEAKEKYKCINQLNPIEFPLFSLKGKRINPDEFIIWTQLRPPGVFGIFDGH